MGQSSLPVLNKVGQTTRWTNSWDDRLFYNIKFEQDIFLKFFFELFFNDNLFENGLLFSKKFLIQLNKFYYPHHYLMISEVAVFRSFILSMFEFTKIVFYFMKFHILRINGLIIIILRLFFPSQLKLIVKKKKKTRLFFYLNNFLKLMKFFLFKKYIQKKIFNLKNF